MSLRSVDKSGKPLVRTLFGQGDLKQRPLWFMRQAGRYLPEYRELRAKAGDFLKLCYAPAMATEVTLQPWRRYRLDAVILFADILLIADAMGQKLTFAAGEGPQLDPIRDASAVTRLKLDRIDVRLGPIYETVSRVRAAVDDTTAVIGFAGAPWTVAAYMVEGGGSSQFIETRRFGYEQPEAFSRLLDLLVEGTAQYLIAQADAGAEALQIFDTWAGLLPETGFRRFCITPTAAIVKRVKARHPGVPIIGFPRGAGSLLLDYVAETGVDAISLDYGFSLGMAARDVASKVAVQGNLDPLAVVHGGDVMRREAERILAALPAGRHVFNVGHGLLPDTPPENVAALVEIVRRSH